MREQGRWLCALLLILLITHRMGSTEETQDPDLLILEVEKGDLSEVQRLLKLGADVNALNNQGLTALTMASALGRLEIAIALIEAGADVTLAEKNNSATPLIWAAAFDPVSKRRIKMGIEAPDRKKKTQIVQVLLKGGAKTGSSDEWGATALHWAADAGNPEIVQALIKADADVNARNHEGLTPLIIAAMYEGPQSLQMVQDLIQAGAKINVKDDSGRTALIATTNRMTPETAAFLLKAGADVNAKDGEGYTALMRASQLARLETIRTLLSSGADVNAKANDGSSVLVVARRAGYNDVIELLIHAGAR